MTKSEWREQQRKLPFEEKLRILEQLRLRDLEIRNAGLLREPVPAQDMASREDPDVHP
jgi:hypothetical protein